MMLRTGAPRAQSGMKASAWQPSFGAVTRPDGVCFRLWAPAARELTLFVRADGVVEQHTMRRQQDGIWELALPDGRAGLRYAYSMDGGDPLPDPTSRFQPDGVHGWSEVIDPTAFGWSDEGWTGVDRANVVIYELHVGTFSADGTFAAVAERIDYLRDLGVTAIELMPLADFPGRWNWGYDGVCLFAPSRVYGRPDDLRALVDRAHAAGLAVFIDVVYNHLGPEGAYLPHFSPQFLTDAHRTPWGKAVNLDGPGCEVVRALLIENALHWIHEYHADGLRLDATHALIDSSGRPFVAELAHAVRHARTPRPFVFAEDHRNLAQMVKEEGSGGWALDGIWADDFHHVIRRMLGGSAHGYYVDYAGTADELATTLRRGWLFVGQPSTHHRAPRGTDPSDVPMRTAVVCLQNHDQVGNRAMGDRVHHTIDAAEWRAAVTVLLTAPTTPLLFMGQEWSASTPFQFFTDFEPSLGQKVTEGRQQEFRTFPEFSTADAAKKIPNPQAASTVEASRLRWEELGLPEHAAPLALHRALLRLRSERPALLASNAFTCDASALDESTVLVQRPDAGTDRTIVICARLRGGGRVALDLAPGRTWRSLLTTEDAAFAPDPQSIDIDRDLGHLTFRRPGAVVIEIRNR